MDPLNGIRHHFPQHFPHGGGIEAAAKAWGCSVEDILDLSTGLHPAGQPDWLAAWLQGHADDVAHYPDVNGEPARQALAENFSIQPEEICMVAGAQAVIEVIFQALRWSSVAIQVPCYNEPIRCALRAGCGVKPFECGEIPQADALWWTSPSNPLGEQTPFPKGFQGVLDESYLPFAERRALGLLPEVIRLGSLTKTFSIPGLRLGYVVADAVTIAQLKAWLPPWPTSTLALHLLPKLLPEADQRDAQVAQARERLEQLLGAKGWQVKPSQASFVLAKPPLSMPDFSAARILARHFPEWPQLHGWVRLGLPHHAADWRRLERLL